MMLRTCNLQTGFNLCFLLLFCFIESPDHLAFLAPDFLVADPWKYFLVTPTFMGVLNGGSLHTDLSQLLLRFACRNPL
jgi:hypothetical protein